MSRHHRKPKSRGGKNNKQNLSKVPPTKHRAWHVLFGNHTPGRICEIINEVWLDPDYELGFSIKSNRFFYKHKGS